MIWLAHVISFLFNQKNNKPTDVIWGCATTGVEWQFLKLENGTFTIDPVPVTVLSQVLGGWHFILESI